MQRTLFGPDPDVCSNRHGGNAQSVAAHESILPRKPTLRRQVFVFVAATGQHGATLEEISDALGRQMHSISARCTELKASGDIVDSGRRRQNRSKCQGAVYVA